MAELKKKLLGPKVSKQTETTRCNITHLGQVTALPAPRGRCNITHLDNGEHPTFLATPMNEPTGKNLAT